MFGILISSENMPKIRETNLLTHGDEYSMEVYLRRSEEWYFIRGYTSPNGRVMTHTVLPAYILPENFEYDPAKIKTDWDQIVRK